jgi:hypothetical protein
LIEKKQLPASITISADTNLDDLAKRYNKLKPEDIDYLRQQQRILREVAR